MGKGEAASRRAWMEREGDKLSWIFEREGSLKTIGFNGVKQLANVRNAKSIQP